ncbi:MAG TPA: hypothetical protein VHX43_00970 [Xanthobacteraceae bacterium]|jgi:deoxycytidine triphosphate deaminase|nr:hypothetical protein [Xanthobacteraceae bacterium]
MATLITGDNLKRQIDAGGFIKDGVSSSVEGAKYDFRISSRILKASFGRPIDINKLPEDQQTQARVDPGEVVFVRTMEALELPKNIIATLSPKRKISHSGIIVLCGFAIDPLYKGPLWVGLYNFSSTPFPLQPGKKLIAAMFYELAGIEAADFKPPEASSDADFPDDLVNLIRNYKPIEVRSFIDQVSEVQRRLNKPRGDMGACCAISNSWRRIAPSWRAPACRCRRRTRR